MKVSHISKMKGGWFVGNFEPTLYKTNDTEVAVKEYKAGDYGVRHYHKIATELTVIVRGIVKMNDELELLGLGADPLKTVVTGIEMFHKAWDQAESGMNVGLLLRGVDKDAIERGQVLCKPGTVKTFKKFEAEVYVLKKEEGGRHTPFMSGYRPQFFMRTTDVTGNIELAPGVEMIMPGDNAKIIVELIYPVAMEDGMRFAIREGGRTVGAGVVTKVLE